MCDKLQSYRLKQGLAELKRKADKSTRFKQKCWTQEEIDYAELQTWEIGIKLGLDWAKDLEVKE